MFTTQSPIAPSLMSAILKSAETAARRIPPAFPLEATVAVNPFLGQSGEDLAAASARLRRVAGVSATLPGSDYAEAIERGEIAHADLEEALAASSSPLKPASPILLAAFAATGAGPASRALPTIADLALEATGVDWPSIIEKTVGVWAAGHFDRGQALWSPRPGIEAFASWRAWATSDLTPEIAGLSGFCSFVTEVPDTAERAILRAARTLGIDAQGAETAFHRLYMDLGGWSQHARWLLWQAELRGGTDRTLADLLAIRLIFEEALFAHVPAIAGRWAETVRAQEAPVEPSREDVALAILQDARERAHQRRLASLLDGEAPARGRPALQAAFCIDVRSEVFRRALESVDPGIETIGFAGFFGLPLAHKAHASDVVEAHLPVLLNPAIETVSHAEGGGERQARIAARTVRAWGRFRQAAVSSFAFVEAAGLVYAAKLVRDALGKGGKGSKPSPAPRVVGGLDAEAKADTAAAVLRAMSLTEGHGEIVLLLGHGARVTNNPHESAYHCGACGGHTGEVSARLLAALLNDPETRTGLVERGIGVPEDTLFVAGLHDTTTDAVTIYAEDLPPGRAHGIGRIVRWLDEAGAAARAERAASLPGASAGTLAARALDWAQTRPEWGLAGCAAFLAAPREATCGRDLGGRAFLHTYDWRADDHFATLQLILTAPVVVASWISLQYYGSSVMPEVFGGGNKLIHNVVGGIGVIEGNSGRLRPGLPWQSVHDGERLMHEPLRLTVMIEAPREAIADVLARHPEVRTLFDQGWLHLFALKEGGIEARYRPGLLWEEMRLDLAA
ncbi:DUF2309 domain-containing protein [Fulvimarina endophytica]|uniref:Probable inorganic carbon transporter subunit DabA n=1 Tax=Fulvimarina endophytica TaxID=2293836 RepID=A0A371X5D7_9HYPH|nr:DUF2309 domain-containing protein [Fulvimarina endophytica]RFC64440.1 DUF2309 domain-containing protein [Fulvimarina endophytica]